MVIWTDNSISHITEFIDEARNDTEKVAKEYMKRLIDYADILNQIPNLGKKIDFVISEYVIRQIIYKKHRIIYSINNEEIIILAVLHTKLDLGKALKKLIVK